MIRPPKTAFLESKHRSELEKIVQLEAFQAACDYALLVLCHELPDAVDPSRGWDMFSQISGAKKVLSILRTLHLQEKEGAKLKHPTLNYKA